MDTIQILKTSLFILPLIGKEITIKHYSTNDDVNDFLTSLDEYHLRALLIAYDHLGTTFDLERSIAFETWNINK